LKESADKKARNAAAEKKRAAEKKAAGSKADADAKKAEQE